MRETTGECFHQINAHITPGRVIVLIRLDLDCYCEGAPRERERIKAPRWEGAVVSEGKSRLF